MAAVVCAAKVADKSVPFGLDRPLAACACLTLFAVCVTSAFFFSLLVHTPSGGKASQLFLHDDQSDLDKSGMASTAHKGAHVGAGVHCVEHVY